jgi:hypothetical protein
MGFTHGAGLSDGEEAFAVPGDVYGDGANVATFGVDGVALIGGEGDSDGCDYWEKGAY